MLRREVIQELFLRLDSKTIQSLLHTANVDLLIGAKHPSWHPDKAEPAVRDKSDLWLYRGRFCICIGGRHPVINEKTDRSDSLFHVNHIYHVNIHSSNSIVSHELEFCSYRTALYKDPSNIPSKVVEFPCKEWSVVDNSLLGSGPEASGITEDALSGEVYSNQSIKWSNVEMVKCCRLPCRDYAIEFPVLCSLKLKLQSGREIFITWHW